MCGIVGTANVGCGQAGVIQMNKTQIHRGPDCHSVYYDSKDDVALGMRRLSIIDIENGIQPMVDKKNQVAIVYNGEVFNAPLIRSIGKKGYQFRENIRQEVVLASYNEYKTECFGKFNGMFACAILDLKERKIICAVDHLSIKPLHYYISKNVFLFASEIKSLIAGLGQTPKIDLNALSKFFCFGFIPAPESIYSIRKLEAGHYLCYDLRKTTCHIEICHRARLYHTKVKIRTILFQYVEIHLMKV